MADDFRVAFDFFDHPKTVQLQSRLGAEAIIALMRLWGFAGRYRPKGVLFGMNPKDIAIASHWTGEPDDFVTVLVDIGFLDKRGNGQFSLHDWKSHNGFLYYKPERQKQAKNAAKSKPINGRNKLRSAESENQQPKTEAPSPTPSPSPSPSPYPSPVLTTGKLAEMMQMDHGGFFQNCLGPGCGRWLTSVIEKIPHEKIMATLERMPEWYEKKGLVPPAKGNARLKFWEWAERQTVGEEEGLRDLSNPANL